MMLFYFTVELFCLLSKNSLISTVSKATIEIIESISHDLMGMLIVTDDLEK